MRERHVFGCHNSRDRRLGAELRSQQLPLRAPWIAEKGDVNDWGSDTSISRRPVTAALGCKVRRSGCKVRRSGCEIRRSSRPAGHNGVLD